MIGGLRFRLLGLMALIIVLAVTALGVADRQFDRIEIEINDVDTTAGHARTMVREEELVEATSSRHGRGLGSRQLWVAVSIAALAIALVAAILRRLIRPLEELTAVAHDLGQGHFGRRVGVGGEDEIGRLGQAFDTMAAQLEAAEQQRRALVSDVAHELRTPLTNLRGQLEGVMDGVLPMDRTVVASLLEESMQLGRLVDDLQELAMADAGELGLECRPVSVAETIEKAVAGMAPGGPTVACDLEPGLMALADAVRLRQILDNLLSNAGRYAASKVRIRALRAEDARVEVVVTDDGPGIPAKDLPLVFERFYRVDSARQRTTGGSGLGLAISRRLAEAHGGTLTIDDGVQVGTRVRLTLPAAD